MSLSITIPNLQLVSEANRSREHWAIKRERVKSQRQKVREAFASACVSHAAASRDPVKITLTRHCPHHHRIHDDDNLVSAFKAVRDEVAHQLGMDDGDPTLTWVCRQEFSLLAPPSVTVTVEDRSTVLESPGTRGGPAVQAP